MTYARDPAPAVHPCGAAAWQAARTLLHRGYELGSFDRLDSAALRRLCTRLLMEADDAMTCSGQERGVQAGIAAVLALWPDDDSAPLPDDVARFIDMHCRACAPPPAPQSLADRWPYRLAGHIQAVNVFLVDDADWDHGRVNASAAASLLLNSLKHPEDVRRLGVDHPAS